MKVSRKAHVSAGLRVYFLLLARKQKQQENRKQAKAKAQKAPRIFLNLLYEKHNHQPNTSHHKTPKKNANKKKEENRRRKTPPIHRHPAVAARKIIRKENANGKFVTSAPLTRPGTEKQPTTRSTNAHKEPCTKLRRIAARERIIFSASFGRINNSIPRSFRFAKTFHRTTIQFVKEGKKVFLVNSLHFQLTN